MELTNTVSTFLSSHGIDAQVTGSDAGKRVTRVFVDLKGKTRIAHVRQLSEDIALALGVNGVRVERHLDKLCVEIVHQLGDTIYLDELLPYVASSTDELAILGVDLNDSILALRLDSPDIAHVLISGTTGSGKTELTKTLVQSVLQRDDRIIPILVDPKGSDFEEFDPYLRIPRAKDIEDAERRLDWVVQEMDKRSPEKIDRPFILFVIDELADFLQTSNKETPAKLTRVLQRGRSAGICVIACTQKPLASVIGSLVKGNFPARIVGRVTSPEESKIASGQADIGAERLLGRGDFVLVSAGEVVRFQAAKNRIENLAPSPV